ncbi:MAG: efflux RND transporter permease subunit, partial [Thermoguttaceae bacterium]|nr:efflux RND transporter permease subunit [Thermoguttaceae bacterium]
AGISARNGILLIAHYLHLVRYEGESFSQAMVERAGKERLAPMLMTALCAGIALVPLIWAAGQPGKEILYPVATVIVGGLISSTLLDFFVRPALFWLFGRRAAERLIRQRELLADESEAELSHGAHRSAAGRF